MNQMQQMLMQAQKMQRELQKAHDALAQKEFTVKKAGIVEVVVMGDKTIKSISIDEEAMKDGEAELIQDTLIMALNEAFETIQKENDEIEERITGRSGLPF